MGTGVGSGENRAVESAQQAISSPLLEDTSIAGAAGVLVNVTGGPDLTLHEINEAATVINDAIGAESNMIFGAVIDDTLKDQVMITVIATGIRDRAKKERPEIKRERRAGQRELKPRERAPEPVGEPVREPVRERAPEPVLERRPEPTQHQPVLQARGRKRSSRRELEIPTFLRRQMD